MHVFKKYKKSLLSNLCDIIIVVEIIISDAIVLCSFIVDLMRIDLLHFKGTTAQMIIFTTSVALGCIRLLVQVRVSDVQQEHIQQYLGQLHAPFTFPNSNYTGCISSPSSQPTRQPSRQLISYIFEYMLGH
jgi:hypothetical protein